MRNIEAEETIARLMLEVNRVTAENEKLWRERKEVEAKTVRFHQLLAEFNFMVEYLQNKEPEVYQNYLHYKLGAL